MIITTLDIRDNPYNPGPVQMAHAFIRAPEEEVEKREVTFHGRDQTGKKITIKVILFKIEYEVFEVGNYVITGQTIGDNPQRFSGNYHAVDKVGQLSFV